uniref:CUB domain-containing protein n=1 Tax=Schistocephalus solidus TaxID=70667 RepID=A0A0X3PQ76_SCHSO
MNEFRVFLLAAILQLQNMFSKAVFQTSKAKEPLFLMKQSHCRCFHFSSHVRKQGIFKSPNYPYSYPAQIDCILYLFQALSDEIVQINFWSFHLPPPRFGVCFDYAAVLTQPPTANRTALWEVMDSSKLVSGNVTVSKALPSPSSSLHILCGGMNTLQRTVFFSRKNQLGIVFHTSNQQALLNPSSKTGVGFHGKYLFINASNFRTEGEMVNGSVCSYVIHSSALNLFTKKGKFFSPGYPSDYPETVQCTYTFIGQPDERVVLSFHLFQLSHAKPRNVEESSSSCLYDNQAMEKFDRVLIHELATSARSNFHTIARICGSLPSFQIVSSEAVLQMTFLSFPNSQKSRGFAGEYAFLKKSNVRPTPWKLNMPTDFEEQAIRRSQVEYINTFQDNSSSVLDNAHRREL